MEKTFSQHMLVKEKIARDKRFFIDSFNLNRITQNRVFLDYKVTRIRVGDILRYRKGVVSLYDTDVFKYLRGGAENRLAYDKYCKEIGMSRRSPDSFDQLIKMFKESPYDMKKGAIFVNQDNVIMEGQHRCCIMLFLYGPKYEIDVVKVTEQRCGLRVKYHLRLFWGRVRNLFLQLRFRKK